MAISFVYGEANTANNPTSGNFPLGAETTNWVAGDFALFYWYGRVTGKTWADNSGGKVSILYDDAGGTNGRISIAYRFLVTGDVATDMAWTSASSANSDVSQGVAIFRDVDTGTPIDVESGTPAAFTNTQSPNPAAVVVVTDQACGIVLFGKNNDAADTFTAPTNYTVASSTNTAAGGDGSDSAAACAYRLALSTGSEDPGAWTLGGAGTDDGLQWTAALRPAAGGAAASYSGRGIGRGVHRGVLR